MILIRDYKEGIFYIGRTVEELIDRVPSDIAENLIEFKHSTKKVKRCSGDTLDCNIFEILEREICDCINEWGEINFIMGK